MRQNTIFTTLTIQFIWVCVLSATIRMNESSVLYASDLSVATPQPFLGEIYYGQEDVWQVFDHELPGPTDNNDYVVHHDGIRYNSVTITPSPGPTLTPNLTATPTAAPPYIPGGYGYTGHAGIDYSLKYVPVLAPSSGQVILAGWSNSANHRLGYGLHVRMSHTANGNYTTWYGHLSTLAVKTDQIITIDMEDPSNRTRILGISGNTGYVFGGNGLDCGPITGGSGALTCGQHLHFEVRAVGDVV
ncbi:MAG: peptidoglycan DD-metalloendopeptidase family protein, partial [Anaerolineae bacterium]|nr:peptidoglycan DD-metalloendopeptidase family protein [Anaerolineae bacterium]